VARSLSLFFLIGVVWAACVPNGPTAEGAGGGGTPIAAVCEDACAEAFPAGVAVYDALASCLLCDACHDRCAADGLATCGEKELGCSAMASDCTSCIASPCALKQLADTTFEGVCAAEGTACASAADCVGLNNCIAKCIVSTGPAGGAGGAGGAL